MTNVITKQSKDRQQQQIADLADQGHPASARAGCGPWPLAARPGPTRPTDTRCGPSAARRPATAGAKSEGVGQGSARGEQLGQPPGSPAERAALLAGKRLDGRPQRHRTARPTRPAATAARSAATPGASASPRSARRRRSRTETSPTGPEHDDAGVANSTQHDAAPSRAIAEHRDDRDRRGNSLRRRRSANQRHARRSPAGVPRPRSHRQLQDRLQVHCSITRYASEQLNF